MLQTSLKYVEYEQSYALFYGGGRTKNKKSQQQATYLFILKILLYVSCCEKKTLFVVVSNYLRLMITTDCYLHAQDKSAFK